MEKLIIEMSHFFTPDRFIELQSDARQICYCYLDLDDGYYAVEGMIEEYTCHTTGTQNEREKILLRYLLQRNVYLTRNYQQLTDLPYRGN